MTPFLARIAGWLLVGLAAWASSIGGVGVVLCFEPDGHVSIEFGGDDCGQCCADDTEGERRAPEQRIGACPCLDFTVSVTDLASVKSSSLGAELAAWASCPVAPVVASAGARVHPPQQLHLPRSHTSAALPHVRSVVLRV
jgi:hypothetical protein